MDLPRFSDWNPFIREAWGALEVGNDVGVRVHASLGLARLLGIRPVFHARVLACDPDRELHWVGHVAAPWIGRGEHWFRLEPAAEGRVRFVQRELFDGLLPRVLRRPLERETARGFDAMNLALKARVEHARSAGTRAACAVP